MSDLNFLSSCGDTYVLVCTIRNSCFQLYWKERRYWCTQYIFLFFFGNFKIKIFRNCEVKICKTGLSSYFINLSYNARLLHLIFKQIKLLLRRTCHKYRFLFLPVFGFLFTIMDKGLDFFSRREIGITPALNVVARCVNTAVPCIFFFFLVDVKNKLFQNC